MSTTTPSTPPRSVDRPVRERRSPAYLNDYELNFNFRTANTIARQYRLQQELDREAQRAQRAHDRPPSTTTTTRRHSTTNATPNRSARTTTRASTRRRQRNDDDDSYDDEDDSRRTTSTTRRATTTRNSGTAASTRAARASARTANRASVTAAAAATQRTTTNRRNNNTATTRATTATTITTTMEQGPSPAELEAFRAKLIPAIDAKLHWAIADHDTNVAHFETKNGTKRTLTIDQLLTSCRFHPGILHDTGRKPAVEIVFSFDTTTSMFPAISELKKKLSNLLKQLLRDLPDIRIAVIAHGDYCAADTFFGSQIYPAMYKLDFTNDLDTLLNFVHCIKGGGGLDLPEAYEFSLMECSRLSWFRHDLTKDEYDDNISRVLVMMGDDEPHAPDTYFKINWRTQLESLHNKLFIKAYGIKCLNKSYSHAFYQELAESTFGTKLELSNFNRMHELVLGLCYHESAEHASIQFAKMESSQNAEDAVVTTTDTTSSSVSTGSSSSSVSSSSTSTSTATTTTAPESTDRSDGLNDEDTLAVHYAIHDPSTQSVTIQGVSYDISINPTECRFARINDIVYVEQSKQKNTKYAQMAKDGHKVTWICHKGAWGLIVDDAIQRR